MTTKRKMRGVFEKVPGSGVWWICYKVNGHRHREKVGRFSVACEAYINRKREIREGRFVPPAPKAVLSFRELVESALAYKKNRLAKATYDGARYQAKRLLDELKLGRYSISEVGSEQIDRVLNTIHKTQTGSTVNRYHALLSGIFKHAVRVLKILPVNPVASVARFKENESRIRMLGKGDEEPALRKAITAACEDPDEAARRLAKLDLAIHTGMRRGEQFALLWEDVSLEDGIVSEGLVTVRGLTSKSGKTRYLPVNKQCREALLTLYRLSSGSPYVSRESNTQRDWRRWFEEAVAAAEIENFKWHDLRHTFASRLVMGGADLRSVQELMGHSSIVQTMKYSHLAPSHLHGVVKLLEKSGQRSATASATGTADDGHKLLKVK